MTIVANTRVAARWLYGVLHGDSTLLALLPGGVREDYLPQSSALPGLVFQLMSGIDLYAIGNPSEMVYADCVYLVKVVGKTASYADLEPAINRAYALLEDASGTVSGGQVFYCSRENQIQYAEVAEGGDEFRHLGGQFRIYVK